MDARATSVRIDPLNMKPEQRAILRKVLRDNPQITFFKRFANYTVPASPSSPKLEVSFKHSLLWHACNPLGKHAGEGRYEVLADEALGKGSYGAVYESLLTINADSQAELICKIKAEDKKRVIKEFYLANRDTEKDLINYANTEYEIMQLLDHLYVKPPNERFLVMRKLPGLQLRQIICLLRKGLLELSFAQRLKLALRLLEATKRQVHDKGVIHRDLGSKNILVLQQGDDFVVNTIDFGISTLIDKIKEKAPFCTNHQSIAPELRTGYAPSSVKCDVYSLARDISEIFGFNSEYYLRTKAKSFGEQIIDEENNGICLDGLFTGMQDGSAADRAKLAELLKKMGQYDPESRCSLDEAIDIVRAMLNAELKEDRDMQQGSMRSAL